MLQEKSDVEKRVSNPKRCRRQLFYTRSRGVSSFASFFFFFFFGRTFSVDYIFLEKEAGCAIATRWNGLEERGLFFVEWDGWF